MTFDEWWDHERQFHPILSEPLRKTTQKSWDAATLAERERHERVWAQTVMTLESVVNDEQTIAAGLWQGEMIPNLLGQIASIRGSDAK